MKKVTPSRRRFVFLAVVALVLGLFISPILYNWQERQRDLMVEVSFVDPHQAVIFWKTPHESLGHIMYGQTAQNRPNQVTQTSSTPGFIHTVVIDAIPKEGLFVSLHTDQDSFFLRPKPFQIKFDPSTFE
jgi:hypothetical protein